MVNQHFQFELLHQDKHCGARLSRLTTPHGVIDLPCFMPVGTCGTVKGLTIDQVESVGSQILLGNTYHLALRPTAELVDQLGGLHQFMGWDKPILTDSGGFQLFSLAKLTKITEHGATFRSHIDGSKMELTPERSVKIQEWLGSDIAMVLDHLIELPASANDVQDALERTTRWAKRSRDAHQLDRQIQFGIVQGGLNQKMRELSAKKLVDLDFPGYAIGGLSVGEPPEEMYETINFTAPKLPTDKPRYLMGVGRPEDLLQSVLRGIDMFDCVMPTRNGRNAMAFTDEGPLKLRNSKHRDDPRPLQAGLKYRESQHSRAYIRHLFAAGEMLGPILLSMHNLAYYHHLMAEAREAIAADRFIDFFERKMAGWSTV
ncbi:MAG: tRNA guanosine(34) transglycosylase Tgt [Planctomycetota bacterium]